ncbi:hypothetical protein [Streptomyces sp. NPDC058382]|uniref:hypothetical protein n=1 Tax=unclassified Streptomyces TaxID=2593676 RepID=UPI0036258C89
MTSSRLETPANAPGVHRAQRRAPHSSPKRPPARYEPHLDGLFTYCLSVLCDHDVATDALGAVLALAERQSGRCPTDEEERKTWLYALARWTCLRRLAEQKQGRQAHRQHDKAPSAKGNRRAPAVQGVHAGRRTPPPPAAAHTPKAQSSPSRSVLPQPAPAPESPAAAEAHRRELAQLAWPEAAGTTPEQREALELAVRHGLTPSAVAAVLGLEAAAARELLAAAACEVERTRAALAVVESGSCPTAGRLTGDQLVLLSATLRRELVRHVDDCPRCRRAAERAGAQGPWPGAAAAPTAALAVVEAPRPSAYVAMIHAQKHLKNRSATPRFDRAGFPMDPKDHAARRDRLRSRVMTTTVVATVVAAPVIALWSAYRGAPLTGEGHDGSSVTASETDDGRGDPYDRYENAGNASPEQGGPRFTDGENLPDVSAEVISVDTDQGPASGPHGNGGLTVEARLSGSTTMITLTASASGPVAWSARTPAPWLRLSSSSGKLAAGASVTIRVLVDHGREPASHWTARVAVAPSGSVVAIHGNGDRRPSGGRPRPSHPARPGGSMHTPRPVPSDPPPSSPDPTEPTPDPTEPTPDPTDPSTTPTDPGEPSGSPDQPTPTGPGRSPSVPPPAD